MFEPMRHSFLRAALAGAATLLAISASAQDAGSDEVTLKNGGLIRGVVVASEPGTSVKIIEMGQTASRTIPWSEVADVERGKYSSAAPQPGPAGPGYAGPAPAPSPVAATSVPVEAAAAPEPTLGELGVVRLHVESPKPVRVFEHSKPVIGSVGGYGFAYESVNPICDSPCDKVIDGRQGRSFSATGDFPGVTKFTVSELRGDVDLIVKPGSVAARTSGVVLTSLGVLAVVGGGSIVLTAALLNSGDDYTGSLPGGTKSSHSGLMTAGVGTLIGGAVSLTAGIILTATSGASWDLQPSSTKTARDSHGALKPRYWMGEF